LSVNSSESGEISTFGTMPVILLPIYRPAICRLSVDIWNTTPAQSETQAITFDETMGSTELGFHLSRTNEKILHLHRPFSPRSTGEACRSPCGKSLELDGVLGSLAKHGAAGEAV
jgi:hypothetical protein